MGGEGREGSKRSLGACLGDRWVEMLLPEIGAQAEKEAARWLCLRDSLALSSRPVEKGPGPRREAWGGTQVKSHPIPQNETKPPGEQRLRGLEPARPSAGRRAQGVSSGPSD